ncbi:hypothetical protein CK203_060080 [Vitis vinifera]|uniref:Uncharacterized protein n=1 Tax=Vitis vinifera TaxID=29760 RepID=A0A438GK40_VITVI|nr:hypothetical protein CK203_060080 [Vitis vinifera]
MDSHIVTIDQFAAAMASIQEAIVVPPPPSPSQLAPQAILFILHSQTELRQLRTSDRAVTWDDFDGLPVALYGIEEDIARGLWSKSSSSNSNEKKPLGGQRLGDVGVIGSVGLRPSKCYQTVRQTSGLYYPPSPRHREASCFIFYHSAAMLSSTDIEAVFIVRHAVELGFSKLIKAGLLTTLTPRPPPHPVPLQFRIDLHCAYHQGPGHETDRCTALRHAIQDLID